MRTKIAFRNTLFSLMLQLVTAVSGLVIPRFFTVAYGSSVNGLVSSIGQFITYISLVEAGIGAAGIVQLYSPLARNNHDEVNGILAGAHLFYRRSGTMFIGLVLLLAVVYPVIIKHEITDEFFIRSMIVILSINGIIDYFILGKYRILLTADQKNYVLSAIQILGVVLSMLLSIFFISLRMDALVVRASVALVYVFRTMLIVHYVKKRYTYLDFSVAPRKEAFKQKSSALLHQIVGMICNNTDLVLLTLLLKTNALIQVSIYSIYNLVAYAVTSLLESIAIGLRATFGQLISEKSDDRLKKSYHQFEFIYINLLFVVYTCMGVLMYPFIVIYSQNFEDAALYKNSFLVVLFTLIGVVQNLRIPGSTIQVAAGHFKETQNAAILEAVINLVISLLLVSKYGIVGVLIGTFCSYLYRTSYVIYYNNKKFIHHSIGLTLQRIGRSLLVSLLIIYFSTSKVLHSVDSWLSWFLAAISIFGLATIGLIGVNSFFEPKTLRDIIERFHAKRVIQ